MNKFNAQQLKETITGCLDDIFFTYNDKKAGVTSTIKDAIPTFQAWYGDEIKYYDSVDDVMSDKFYGGKSLIELIDLIVIHID